MISSCYRCQDGPIRCPAFGAWRQQFGSDDFFPLVLNAFGGWNGTVYGLPFDNYSGLLFYNRCMLEEAGFDGPPATWEELKDTYGPALTKDGKHAYALQSKRNETQSADSFARMLWPFGGSFLDADFKSNLLSEESQTGLKFRQDLMQYMPEGIVSYDHAETVNGLAQGDFAMITEWSAFYSTLTSPETSTVRELVRGHPTLTEIAEALLSARAVLHKEFQRFERRVRSLARADDRARLLMSAPGVGVLVSLTYASAIDEPERFERSKQVGAHFGLTPKRYQSGEIDVGGRISKIGDRSVHIALYEAANVILTKAVRGGALKSWGMHLAARAGKKKAKVALARKLAVILHRMLITGTPFNADKAALAKG